MILACKSCQGTGKINCSTMKGKEWKRACRLCHGTGKMSGDSVQKKLSTMVSDLKSWDNACFNESIASLEAVSAKLAQSE